MSRLATGVYEYYAVIQAEMEDLQKPSQPAVSGAQGGSSAEVAELKQAVQLLQQQQPRAAPEAPSAERDGRHEQLEARLASVESQQQQAATLSGIESERAARLELEQRTGRLEADLSEGLERLSAAGRPNVDASVQQDFAPALAEMRSSMTERLDSVESMLVELDVKVDGVGAGSGAVVAESSPQPKQFEETAAAAVVMTETKERVDALEGWLIEVEAKTDAAVAVEARVEQLSESTTAALAALKEEIGGSATVMVGAERGEAASVDTSSEAEIVALKGAVEALQRQQPAVAAPATSQGSGQLETRLEAVEALVREQDAAGPSNGREGAEAPVAALAQRLDALETEQSASLVVRIPELSR